MSNIRAGITDYDLAMADAVALEFTMDIFDSFVARYWIDRSNLIAHDEGCAAGFRRAALGIRTECPYTEGDARRAHWLSGYNHGNVAPGVAFKLLANDERNVAA